VTFFVAGLSYRTAPVELRERLAIPAGSLKSVGLRLALLGGLTETVVLSTCNRVEIYGVTIDDFDPASLFHIIAPSIRDDITPHLYVHEGAQAVNHLLSVAGGLDSMVLGETEITGQVHDAYEAARGARLTGRVLNPIFQKAFQTSKEIRTETRIGYGTTSAGSVALALAMKIFGEDLSPVKVMVIGAGAMATTCVRYLTKHGVRSVVVCNRSLPRAVELAAEFGGRAAPFDEKSREMAIADIVITMTGSPEPILHRADVESAVKARGDRPLFLIDIAVPRDIDAEVRHVGGAYLYDLDDLESIAREHLKDREADLARCNAIIERKNASLMDRLHHIEEESHDTRIQPEPRCVFPSTLGCRG
jgi:glutamyl-tRNA reductase